MRRANRPRFLRAIKSRAWRTSLSATATASKELKTAQNRVELGWIGLFVVLLGRLFTGSSLSASGSHRTNYLDHFLPLSPTSYL